MLGFRGLEHVWCNVACPQLVVCNIECNIWNEKQHRLSSSIHKSKRLCECVKLAVLGMRDVLRDLWQARELGAIVGLLDMGRV